VKRSCTHCQRPFTPMDLVREESRGIEAERKALGLEGLRFLYYRCPGCDCADIFVDVLQREGEPVEEFTRRRTELEGVVHQLHADGVEVVLGAREQAHPA
jgi:hypothetical protein